MRFRLSPKTLGIEIEKYNKQGMSLPSKSRVIYSIILSLLFSSPLWAEEFTGKVVGVADGDTITVIRHGRGEKVRLYGIDCPEKGQAFGNRAKQFTSQMVFGKDVLVKTHGCGKYNRILGDIFLPDGGHLNQELVRNGYAWCFKKYVKDVTLARLEEEARTAKVGLWADPHAVPPWEFRRSCRD
jgi:micrococcal nuclease